MLQSLTGAEPMDEKSTGSGLDANTASAMHAAETARRAMFDAASRVLGYHTAALQSKASRNGHGLEAASAVARRQGRHAPHQRVNDERERCES